MMMILMKTLLHFICCITMLRKQVLKCLLPPRTNHFHETYQPEAQEDYGNYFFCTT